MDSKPVLPMNRPFAELGYNSSGLNIVLERLLLATRRPSTHYPLASGAAFFDPLRAICRRATNHLQHTAQHLATPCTASAISLRVIRWHPADICWHEPMPLTARRTNRRRKQEP